MLKVKSGETDKLGLLYERHKGKLFGFFYNLNGNSELSEDLVQNVFIRMMKYKHTYSGEGSFMAWMFTTARNVNHDYFKKHKNELKENELSSYEYRIKNDEDMERDITRKEQMNQLKTAMNKLDAEKREVLVLSKLKEMKFNQIGEVLGCSEGAAKVKAHRALKELRTIFMELEMR
nr:sigma-70 family RNA polymerase sigma factor [Croceivirga thetidis]